MPKAESLYAASRPMPSHPPRKLESRRSSWATKSPDGLPHDVPPTAPRYCGIFASRLTTTCLAFDIAEIVPVGAQSPRAFLSSHVLLAQDHDAVMLNSENSKNLAHSRPLERHCRSSQDANTLRFGHEPRQDSSDQPVACIGRGLRQTGKFVMIVEARAFALAPNSKLV